MRAFTSDLTQSELEEVAEALASDCNRRHTTDILWDNATYCKLLKAAVKANFKVEDYVEIMTRAYLKLEDRAER